MTADCIPSLLEHEFLCRSGITVSYYVFDQYNADPARAAAGIGSSACGYIQGKLAHRFLTKGLLPDLKRAEVAQWVKEYDDRREPGGCFRHALLKDIFKTTPDFEMLVTEYVNPDGPFVEVRNLNGLMAAMLQLLAVHSIGDMVFLFTNPTIGSAGTGNTYALFISKSGNHDTHVFMDTHPPKVEVSKEAGAVCACKMRSSKLDEDIAAFATWIWSFHMSNAGMEIPFELVSMSVNWEATCQARMHSSEAWQKVMAMAPVLPALLPGDYLLNSFGGSLICQLCAVGMKLAPLQSFMLERFQCYGGSLPWRTTRFHWWRGYWTRM